MPSTLVHVGFAGLIGAALLADRFDARAILLVMGLTAVPDLDVFVGMVVPGTHRAALHTIFFPGLLAALLVWDVLIRNESFVRARWGGYGVRVAWVSILAMAVAGIGLDLFYNGINILYPFHDRFYDFSGEFVLSNQRGIVVTFFETETARGGTTADTHYYTGVDPVREETPENVERLFPVADTGERFVLMVTGFLVVAVRLVENRLSA